MAEIRIVGTAHVSQKSVEEVQSAIEEFKPDIVAISLTRHVFRHSKNRPGIRRSMMSLK